jgi:predicted nucleic acid-binding protein
VILYIDTSAFVKLIIDEPRATEARSWYAEAREVASSVITYPEATAALCRKDREEGPDRRRLNAWLAALEMCWQRCFRLPVDERSAARSAVSHGLRGMDAVQLAAASDLRAHIIEDMQGADLHFLAFDARLIQAAEHEGFATLGGSLE